MLNNLTSTEVRANEWFSFNSLTQHIDGNHKPEMAIALTSFSALCGFLPIERIALYLEVVPEFAGLIPLKIRRAFIDCAASRTASSPETRNALRELFTSLMTAEESRFVPALKTLVERYREGGVNETENRLADLVIRLNDQFPGDIGIFCPFVLNYVKLEKGEAIFLGAGEPHAYVSGGMDQSRKGGVDDLTKDFQI